MNFSSKKILLKNALPLAFGITLLSGNVFAASNFSDLATRKTEIILKKFDYEKYRSDLFQSLEEFDSAQNMCEKFFQDTGCLSALDRALNSMAVVESSFARKSIYEAATSANAHGKITLRQLESIAEAKEATGALSAEETLDFNALRHRYEAISAIQERSEEIDSILRKTGHLSAAGNVVGRPAYLQLALSGQNDYFANRNLVDSLNESASLIRDKAIYITQAAASFRLATKIGTDESQMEQTKFIASRILELGQKLRRKGLRVRVDIGMPPPNSKYSLGSVEQFSSDMISNPNFGRNYNMELYPAISSLELLLNLEPNSELSHLLTAKRINEIRLTLRPYCAAGEHQLLICPPSALSTDDFVRNLKAMPGIKN